MASHWYVIHVYSGFEKKVASSVREQAEQKGLADKFEEILVPTEEVVEVKRGAKVNAERKFFPGYVLIKMDLSDETWHLVKNTAKVTGFLGGKGLRPSPISEAEASRIMRQVQEGIERPKPSITFEIGEQVRVSDGSLRSTVSSRRSTRRRRGSRWRCRSSAVPPRSSSSTRKSRKFDIVGFAREASQGRTAPRN
jgi:transcription termination/antitermination protein NusG